MTKYSFGGSGLQAAIGLIAAWRPLPQNSFCLKKLQQAKRGFVKRHIVEWLVVPSRKIIPAFNWKWNYAIGALLAASISMAAHAADLLEIYRLAQRNDPTLDAARYALEAAQEKIPQARAGLLPVVAVNGSDNNTYATNTFSNAPPVNRDVRAWNWTLQLTQPLLRAQNIYALTGSKALVEQAIAQYAQAEQDMILRVAQAYFDVLIARENIEVAEGQLRAAKEQLDLAKRGFETGTNAITDVHDTQSRVDLAHSQRVAAQNELDSRRAEVEKIVGNAPAEFVALLHAVEIPGPQPDDPQAWIAQARENNPAVRAPQAALLAAEAEVKKIRADYAPTLDVMASYGKNFSSGSITTPSDFSTQGKSRQAGVQLTVPIFSGFASGSRVTEAIANKNKIAAELEIARRQAGTDARQAYSAIVNGLSRIAALQSAVESSQSAVRGNQAGYRLGIKVVIDVLNAEQQLYTAQRDLVKARYDTLFQGFKLRAAAGVLTEWDVVAVNALLVH